MIVVNVFHPVYENDKKTATIKLLKFLIVIFFTISLSNFLL